MEGGGKLKKIENIWSNQMQFGTCIHNTKVQKGIKNQSVIMQVLYAVGWIKYKTKLLDLI